MVETPNASNIYEIGLDGKVLRQITTASHDGSNRIAGPRWDPAGDRIWVTIWQPGVGILSPADGEPRIVGSGPTPGDPGACARSCGQAKMEPCVTANTT
ncbi:MAG TPA: hypothetical protein VJZ72_06860 [Candidatus Limnocylindrales bacterium]|nr:hypothetical protein [Candidatus Limnocylindrales bacterium]